MKRACLVVYSTFPNMRSAKKTVDDMVGAGIIACGNIFKIFSIYRWQGKIEKSPEYGVLMKTTRSKYRAVEKYIKKHHPYGVPEIVAWQIERGEKDYLKWIRGVTE
ncbi:MAG: divalent-cation tolerance protein CutA [candidate division WOR-3 bacterium]